jgi:hypothetical protein
MDRVRSSVRWLPLIDVEARQQIESNLGIDTISPLPFAARH